MPVHKRGPWSQTEDQYLLQLVQTQGAHNWVRISSLIQTRSPKQCRERYHQNLKPNLNHDPITPEEGILIEQMVQEMGKRWAEIARRLRGRSDNAVKNWWNGGMNRRRRNQQRRAEMEVRQTAQMPHHQPFQHQTIQQQALPDQTMYFANGAISRPTWGYEQQQNIYQQHAHIPPSIIVPQIGQNRLNAGRPFESPLPSPSAYSQISEQPSLMSDHSSYSNRSPQNGNSPVELPPLGGQQPYIRRASSLNQMRMPGYSSDEETQIPMQFSRSHDGSQYKQSQMLQEPFNPNGYAYQSQQSLRAPMDYAQMQYHQQSALPQLNTQMAAPYVPSQQPPQLQSNVSYLPSQMQTLSERNALPSMHHVPAGNATPEPHRNGMTLDPALSQGGESPKEKMSLSSMIN